jgi:hypothetical protein
VDSGRSRIVGARRVPTTTRTKRSGCGWFQRVLKKDPVDRAGWSCFFTWWEGNDVANPGIHPFIRGNGAEGRAGWLTSPRLEELRDAWLDAPDLPTQKRIASEIQAQALRDVTFIPLGLTIECAAPAARAISGEPASTDAYESAPAAREAVAKKSWHRCSPGNRADRGLSQPSRAQGIS